MPYPGQQICNLYADELRILDHGHALYEPEPNEGEGEVEIGDVGYIDSGRFVRFSNVFQTEPGIPAIEAKFRAVLKLARLDHGVMSSKKVRHEKVEVGLSADVPTSGISLGVCLTFSCESDRGASLITRHQSKNEKAKFHNVLEDHFVQYILSYKEMANVERLPIKSLHDIVLVTRRVMTGDWATIAFYSRTEENSASFDIKAATVTASGKIWGKWSEHASYPKRHGPTRQRLLNDDEDLQEESLDQCIFITPFRISDLGWYRKIKLLLHLTQKSGSSLAPASALGSAGGTRSSLAGLFGSSQMPTQAAMDLAAEAREEGEILAAHEVLAFHAFEASISMGFNFDFICISEEDIRRFRTESCPLENIQSRPVDLSHSTFSNASVDSNMKVGRLLLDQGGKAQCNPFVNLAQHMIREKMPMRNVDSGVTPSESSTNYEIAYDSDNNRDEGGEEDDSTSTSTRVTSAASTTTTGATSAIRFISETNPGVTFGKGKGIAPPGSHLFGSFPSIFASTSDSQGSPYLNTKVFANYKGDEEHNRQDSLATQTWSGHAFAASQLPTGVKNLPWNIETPEMRREAAYRGSRNQQQQQQESPSSSARMAAKVDKAEAREKVVGFEDISQFGYGKEINGVIMGWGTSGLSRLERAQRGESMRTNTLVGPGIPRQNIAETLAGPLDGLVDNPGGGSSGTAGGDNAPMTCTNCETTTTPLWRRDPDGLRICNACDLYYKLHGEHRPVGVVKKRKRASSDASSTRKTSRGPQKAVADQGGFDDGKWSS